MIFPIDNFVDKVYSNAIEKNFHLEVMLRAKQSKGCGAKLEGLNP